MKHLAASWNAEYISRDGRVGPAVTTFCDKLDFVADVSDTIEHADCPLCVDAWETAPLPITTRDLAEVVAIVADIAPARTAKTARALLERLERPRHKPEEETP